jgi:hypothetical protein
MKQNRDVEVDEVIRFAQKELQIQSHPHSMNAITIDESNQIKCHGDKKRDPWAVELEIVDANRVTSTFVQKKQTEV